MKRLLVIAVAMLLFYGCAHGGARQQVLLEAPPLDGVLRVVGRFGIYSACPFNDGKLAWTSAHGIDPWPELMDMPLFGGRWEDGYGNSGTTLPLPLPAMTISDFALVRRADGQAWDHAYPLATEAPKPGDRVHILSSNRKSKRTAFEREHVVGEVIRLLADNLVLEEESRKSSSGGCVLNDKGEVVALPTWGPFPMDNLQEVAIALGVWSSIESVSQILQEARAWQEAQAQ